VPQEPLLPRIAAAERAAVSLCIERYGPLVWALARRMTRTAADAEDAVQDIFTELWRCAARFDAARGPEYAFVITLARRRLIDRLRADVSRARVEQVVDAGAVNTAAYGESSGELQLDAERATRELSTLPEQQQRVILLSVVEGFSHSEIARKVGLPIGTVKTHVRRGLLQIRGRLTGSPGSALPQGGLT
jgi:RNA polymerase sigma-70 factor (ECF subfamily)